VSKLAGFSNNTRIDLADQVVAERSHFNSLRWFFRSHLPDAAADHAAFTLDNEDRPVAAEHTDRLAAHGAARTTSWIVFARFVGTSGSSAVADRAKVATVHGGISSVAKSNGRRSTHANGTCDSTCH
jgi:hypothetical protein